MKLIAIIPLLFAGFFLCTSIDMVHDIIHPMGNDMRLMAIGVFLLQMVGFVVSASISVVLFIVTPWKI